MSLSFRVFVFLVCCSMTAIAQNGFTPVTHETGTITQNGISVIATPSPGVGPPVAFRPGFRPGTNCMYVPYTLGHDIVVGSNYHTTPHTYEYEFLTPVKWVRVAVMSIQDSEIVSVAINNQVYEIQPHELSPWTMPCTQTTAIIWNGSMTIFGINPVPPHPPGCVLCVDPFAVGELNISGRISSFKINLSGIKGGFVGYHIYYREYIIGANEPCEGETLRLRTLPAHYANALSYNWSGPAGFTSNLRDPEIPNAGLQHAGVYSLRIVTATDTITDTMHVHVKPIPVPAITDNGPVCEGRDLLLFPQVTNASESDALYVWNGPKGFYSRDSMAVVKNVRSDNLGKYRLRVNLNGCIGETGYEFSRLIFSDTTYLNQEICRGDQAYFNDQYFSEPGMYFDTLINARGCDSVIAFKLSIKPSHPPDIYLDPASGFCQGDTVVGYAVDQSEYQWYLNDSILGVSGKISLPLSERINNLLAIHVSEDGCLDSLQADIMAELCCLINIPNAFTPNGDGKNDEFGIVAPWHFRELNMMIVDRWGRTVYRNSVLNGRWDGRYEGEPLPVGTYYYHIDVSCMDGRRSTISGDVLLVR